MYRRTVDSVSAFTKHSVRGSIAVNPALWRRQLRAGPTAVRECFNPFVDPFRRARVYIHTYICRLSHRSHSRSRLLPLQSARLLRLANYRPDRFSRSRAFLLFLAALPFAALRTGRRELSRSFPPLLIVLLLLLFAPLPSSTSRELDFPTSSDKVREATTNQDASAAITKGASDPERGLTEVCAPWISGITRLPRERTRERDSFRPDSRSRRFNEPRPRSRPSCL